MKTFLFIAAIIILAVGVNIALNAQCPADSVAVVTWHGIACY